MGTSAARKDHKTSRRAADTTEAEATHAIGQAAIVESEKQVNGY
jgi:hypothetical protein